MLSNPIMANEGPPVGQTLLAERTWFNAVWFQSFWFICVLGREDWLALGVLFLVIHFALTRPWLQELRHLLPVALVGITADTTLSLAGLYQFQDGTVLPGWLCLLWFGFAAALPRSLGFLVTRPWLAAACGAIAFPLNYFAGVKLGAVEYGMPLLQTVVIQAVLWTALLPALALGSRRTGEGDAA